MKDITPEKSASAGLDEFAAEGKEQPETVVEETEPAPEQKAEEQRKETKTKARASS